VLDGDVIRRKYKVKPMNYWNKTSGKNDPTFEFEERIQAESIPIKPFLKGIIIRDNSPKKLYYPDWASWKENFKLPFDVIVKTKSGYLYAKDLAKMYG